MNVYTLTLCPAYDMHCYAENFTPFHENLAKILEFNAGGKGVNISRALNNYGVKNTAIIVLGKENSSDFENNLKKDCVNYSKILVDGRIRENITLHTNNNNETRISFEGFVASDGLIDEVLETFNSLIKKDNAKLQETILTFTGRFPSGVTKQKVIDFLVNLREKGVKIVVDSRSINLTDLKTIKPYLIKPNQEEVFTYTNMQVNSIEEGILASKELYSLGIENVIVSLGEKGGVLCSKQGVYTAIPPKITPISTVGAGDSLIAGFISALNAGDSLSNALRLAVSFGSSACLVNGSNPPNKKDIQKIYDKVIIR